MIFRIMIAAVAMVCATSGSIALKAHLRRAKVKKAEAEEFSL